jgi:hypothetical protein
MALEFHRDRHIVSRPKQRRESNEWTAYAVVTWWDESGFHSHNFSDLLETFDSEEEAAAFGFAIARAWIDDSL